MRISILLYAYRISTDRMTPGIDASLLQAAQELQSELKKDTESLEEPPAEKITTVSEEEKPVAKVSSTKENSQV